MNYKAKIFYSYSHEDEPFREKLETHLAILKRNDLIEEWHDRRIAPGANWEEEINENIDAADIILLLVSSNFLASDYCYDSETIRALERHKDKNDSAIVIPIILKPCLWTIANFAKLQSLPKDGKPITTWDNEEEAWLDVATGILEKARSFKSASHPVEAILEERVEKPQAVSHRELVRKFLCTYKSWYFSPLRVIKWGGRRLGFEQLYYMETSEVRSILSDFVREGLVITTESKKGNTIYKIKNSHC
ncbi:toll/interleukin-1 receptor domain-containing protein [Echinicola sp. 20G]|uniref:toll/interleukin-1 receptor domain-containing protein n=1 Tax=Echinicola sp. 20G TaxID=2781961 RepID=UPI00190FD84C|nr:toll/interleukin-1 receptor domain-containing protein [Echinicola sp. 20G]